MKCVVKNNSSMDIGPLLPLLKSLLPYTRKKLGFNRPPSLFFASDTENASKPLGKTAFYDPAEVSITIFVDGRHPKDILRSISHELVHHMQHERGDFGADMATGEGYAQKNDALRELEREAYESGNMCFRDWEDENKQALQEAKQHFNKESDTMSAKKKRNDNVESLLMNKWGLKGQTRQEFNIEVPDSRKSFLSEDLARHIVKEAINRKNKNIIREAKGKYDSNLSAIDLADKIRILIRKEEISMNDIREIGIQLRMGRRNNLDGYDLLWQELGDGAFEPVIAVNDENRGAASRQNRIQKELAIIGMKNWSGGVQKVLGRQNVPSSIMRQWLIRSDYINPEGKQEPVVMGHEMLSALEDPNRNSDLIIQIANRAEAAEGNLEKFSSASAQERIEPLYNVSAEGERVRAGEEEMGYRAGMSFLPKRSQKAMDAWGEKKKTIQAQDDYQKLETDEEKNLYIRGAFKEFAGQNPEIYKNIQRDYSAPKIESGRGDWGSKINRVLRVGPWDYFADKPIGIERSEKVKEELSNVYDDLVRVGKINSDEFSFENFIDSYNKKVEESILIDIDRVAGDDGINKNLSKGFKTWRSMVPTSQAGDGESAVGVVRSDMSYQDDGDISVEGKFWSLVSANPDLMPPDISAGSTRYMEKLQSEFEQKAGEVGFDPAAWAAERTTDEALAAAKLDISDQNIAGTIDSLKKDYEKVQVDSAKHGDEPAWWPHETPVQESMLRKVVQEALKRKFGE